ncbi:MAG: sigma-70 family RNA polymerase sigma factor [Actinobacteria bacterium]|nr:sigma-70 family RNA polymerase sigma factor [Actinomycetota bacterium]
MGDAGGGDESILALEQLYRRRYGRFLRLALAIVGSRELAADVVQEAFVRALRGRHGFRGEGSLEAWMWRTVTNVALTTRKRAAATDAEPLDGEAEAQPNGSAAKWPELRAAITLLPERQRQALFLRHYAELSYDEIAEVLGVARGTVSATLHAAHASLRQALSEVHQ